MEDRVAAAEDALLTYGEEIDETGSGASERMSQWPVWLERFVCDDGLIVYHRTECDLAGIGMPLRLLSDIAAGGRLLPCIRCAPRDWREVLREAADGSP